MSAILGRKVGMTAIFDETGNSIPVTVIEVGPCFVTQIRTVEKDGYEAIQLGYDEVTPKHLNQPRTGHLKKAGVKPLRVLREFRDTTFEEPALGNVITCEVFKPGDMVRVSGNSKGRGFTGVMKRHNFKGMKASHGVHESYRGGGSVGAASDPARTYKAMKMAGQHGNARVTVSGLAVMQVLPEKNLLLVKGAVPGARNGLLEIQK
jgi:large subunit ribosomal protein L3